MGYVRVAHGRQRLGLGVELGAPALRRARVGARAHLFVCGFELPWSQWASECQRR
jgi:hypothetical protein